MTAPGFVVYHGPSRLNGAPIVAVVTLSSLNAKTGNMAQAWVLDATRDPMTAVEDGTDAAVCGSCQHRATEGRAGRSCYVVLHYGPNNVWKAFSRGVYPVTTPAAAAPALAGRALRLAAYGDPAAVPTAIWRPLVDAAGQWTGYTHAWRTCDPRLAEFCMASVDSPAEAIAAAALGWRTFRVRTLEESVGDGEIVCPASAEAGHRLTCADCRLCVGQARREARSVAIVVHGQRARFFEERRSA